MRHVRHSLLLATALIVALPAAVQAAEENTTVPTNLGFNPGAGQLNPGPQAQAPSQSSEVRVIPTPEEARAALLEPISTQPSLGAGPIDTLPKAEATEHQSADKQRESKNVIGGPQGSGANSNHPQSGQQGLGEKPATSGSSGSAKSDAKPDGNAAAALTREPPPSGPIGAVGQTIPAKFSKRNDILDRVPIMAFPLRLSDEDRKKIYAAVMAEKSAPAPDADALMPASELSTEQALNGMYPLPQSVSGITQVQRFKYVKAKDKVLLVEPSTRVVVDQIKS